MDNLKYKGYIGTIQFSEGDNCFYGKVLGMKRACITYEGENASELIEDFKGAVDMYLEHCQRKGINPEQPYNDILKVHIPSEIHFKVVSYAQNNGTSIDDFILNLIEKQLETVN
jgi:predicted HicB family RNase H-like nuclease